MPSLDELLRGSLAPQAQSQYKSMAWALDISPTSWTCPTLVAFMAHLACLPHRHRNLAFNMVLVVFLAPRLSQGYKHWAPRGMLPIIILVLAALALVLLVLPVVVASLLAS